MNFTQYMMPDGRAKPVTITRPDTVEAEATRLSSLGVRFEIEVLPTGEVSMTAERTSDGEVEVLAIEVVENGPPVPCAVDRLVNVAAAKLLEAFK